MTLPWPPPDPRITAFIDDAAPGIIGAVDDALLADIAARLEAAASRLALLSSSIDDAHSRYRRANPDTDADSVADAIDAGRLRLTGPDGEIGRAGAAVTGVVAAIGDYRRLVADTGTELTLLAAVADREMIRDEIAERIGLSGSGTAAQLIGREAVAAAAADSVAEAQDLSGGLASGGLLSGGLLSGGIVAGLAASSAAVRSSASDDDVDVAVLTDRAALLAAALPACVRMAVGVGTTAHGGREIVVGTSDPAPYLRRGIELGETERIVGTGVEPELAILADLVGRSVTPVAVAAVGTPAAVAAALAARGVMVIDVAGRAEEVALEGGGGEPTADPAIGT